MPAKAQPHELGASPKDVEEFDRIQTAFKSSEKELSHLKKGSKKLRGIKGMEIASQMKSLMFATLIPLKLVVLIYV